MKLTKNRFKRYFIVGCLIAIIATLAILPNFVFPRTDTSAASVADCLSSSYADQVASVQAACNDCFGNPSVSDARGALWFNSSSTYKNSDVVNVEAGQTSVNIYLWGQVYSCRRSTGRANTANYIWLGDSGQQYDPSQRISYITVPNSLSRGTHPGKRYAWYIPSDNYGAGQITDINAFIDDADSHETVVEDGVTYDIYTKYVSVNRCFSPNSAGAYIYDGSNCYGQDSSITIRVPQEEPPGPEPGSGSAYFYSTSTIDIPAQNGDVDSHSVTTDPDGESMIKLSTDGDTFTVNFSHTMYYVNNTSYEPEDKFDTVSTNWSVSTNGASYSSSGTYSTNGKYNSSSQVNSNQITISLDAGQTKTVCQTISYQPKYVSFWKEDIGYWRTTKYSRRWIHEYYQFHVSSTSGSGLSKACVEVTRPADPTGGPYSTGTMDSTLMYAGQDASIGWNVQGKSVATRRLSAWQAVVYQVPVEVNYYDGITTGETRYRGNAACGYYGGKSSQRYCDVYNSQSGSLNYGESTAIHRYSQPYYAIVPDYVGDKYCNTFAYFYEYWYYISNGPNAGWHHDSARDYWVVYNSVCRTIAKKPSISIWNNSILSDGGVKTSTSYRYVPANIYDFVDHGQDRLLYGSWAEYLAVVNGSVDGFASGSTLSNGTQNGRGDVYPNSPLTISNQNNTLGSSGVQPNTALRTRLDTYLKNQASSLASNEIGGSSWTNMSGTTIVRRSGDLEIVGDIKLNSSTQYSSIYHLPQVIIFVDGNVNISSNVQQIDAWIIATGTINTCREFTSGVTQAEALNYNVRGTCTNQLVFNGPIIAKNILLNRSFGSDPIIARQHTDAFGAETSDRQTPAEIFNYRADAYIWAYAQAGRYDSSYTESYTRELAPRY